MKHLSFLIFLVIAASVSSAQKYQDALLYGENKNRIDINYLLGLPNDTFAIPSFPQDKRRKPHVAVKHISGAPTIYLWDTVLYKWSAYSSGSGSGITQIGNTGNWGLIRVNDSTYRVDSSAVISKYQSEKTRDSLIALILAAGSPQGLQDVITEDNELTSNNTLNFKGHSLTLDSLLALYAYTKSGSGRNAIFQLTDNGFKAYSTLTGTNRFFTIQTLGLEETVRIESIDEDLVRASAIDVMLDTIWMRASYGNYFWDSLQHSNSATNKMLVWDSVNNKIATQLIPTGGSSDSSIIYIDTTFTRLARVINTDTLLFKSLRFRLNGVTVTPDPTDSTESWDFAVIEPSDTASMLATYVRRQELIDTAAAIRGDFPVGGGGSPAGNYGNVQLNRNGALATPASDSLDFDAGLSIKGSLTVSSLTSGRVPFISTSGLITDDAKLTFSAGSYPSLTIGAAGGVTSSLALRDAAGTFGYISSETGLSHYGSTTYNAQWFYPSTSLTAKPFLRLYYNGGPKSAAFYKTVITADTLVGGASDGTFHGEGTLGDSTSTATTNNGHMYRAIARMYGNGASVNTFYSTIYMGNTNAGASQGHGAAFQSDFIKTGANTVDIFYHGAFLSDQVLSGIVNKRYGIHYWDAHVNTGAALGFQAALKFNKLKSANGLNAHLLADSSDYAQLDGNMYLGDSLHASGAKKAFHFFNGTAPTSNISGAILYAESGELKVRDSGGNITTLSDPAGGSGTDNANVGSGYRWVKPTSQEIKTFFDGLYLDIDSSSNTDGLTVKVDTASMFPQIRSTIPASTGAQISGTPAANQMTFWTSATEIKGSNAFTVSDALYPSFQVGGTGTNEGTILVKDPAGTTGGMSGGNGMTLFSSSTYKQLDFYSHVGGSYLLQMKNNAGVLTADFQSGVAVTIASTLQVNTTIKQAGTASALSGYMNTNSGNLASTTNLNPGILVYNASNNGYGMDLGYNSSRYATRIFAPTSTGISFGRMATGATAHSNYTESMYLNGSGNLGIGDATPASMLTVGNGDLFQVNSSGDIIKINNVTYTWPSSQGSTGDVLKNSDGAGTLVWGTVTDEGTYTPTLTNTTNIASSTAYTTYYYRIGDVYHVWGAADIDATTALTVSEMGLSLPVASSVGQVYELSGTASFEDNTVVQIKGDATNDRAMFRFTPQTATNNKYSFHFTFKYFAP